MHAPDGFLTAGTALATGAISTGAVGLGLRRVKQTLLDRHIPLAGLAAAFVFAAQMFNFPVAAGTTGHLLGATLVAILLGPHLGALVVTVVVFVQALIFADGGLTALGYNVLNMAVVPAYGGYAIFSWIRRAMPKTASGVIAATGLAAWASVVLASMAFSIQWLFGATAPVTFTEVFTAMAGVHMAIGVGEGVISALVVGAVLSTRPDLVFGASDLDAVQRAHRERVPLRTFLIGGALAVLFTAAIVSQFAVDAPDGLESVAEETGIAESAREHGLGDSLFADYAVRGISNEAVSLAVAGIVGSVIVLAVGWGMLSAVRGRESVDRSVT